MKYLFLFSLIVAFASCRVVQPIIYTLPMATMFQIKPTLMLLDSICPLGHSKDVYVTVLDKGNEIYLIFNRRSKIHPNLTYLVNRTNRYLMLSYRIPLITGSDFLGIQNPSLSCISMNGFWVKVDYEGTYLGSGIFY